MENIGIVEKRIDYGGWAGLRWSCEPAGKTKMKYNSGFKLVFVFKNYLDLFVGKS